MATNKYIILANSNNSVSKRFSVVQMAPVLERSDDIQRTLSGTLDKSAGVITALYQYVLRIRADETDAQYGSKSDLEYLFLLNNPQTVPSDVIILTDHYGITHNCIFAGNLAPENVTTVLEGPNAIFLVKITLLQIAAVVEDDNPCA